MTMHDKQSATAARDSFVPIIGISQIISWSTLYYAFPLIGEHMRDELGWSKPAIYLAATIGLLFAAAVAVPVGTAIDRGLGRSVMGFGSLAAATYTGNPYKTAAVL